MGSPHRNIAVQRIGSPQVIIASTRPGLRVAAYLADTAPVRSGGYGGWEVASRARQVGFVEWRGVEPRGLTLPLVLASVDGADQEPFIRNLERMARPEPKAGNEPPWVRITGAVPVAAVTRWVIQGIEWSAEDVIRREVDGHRIRQGVTLNLVEHVTPDLAFTRSAAQKVAAARARRVTITALKGDTFAKIAVRRFGKRGRWKDIADLNPGLPAKPNVEIKAGRKVRVPRK